MRFGVPDEADGQRHISLEVRLSILNLEFGEKAQEFLEWINGTDDGGKSIVRGIDALQSRRGK